MADKDQRERDSFPGQERQAGERDDGEGRGLRVCAGCPSSDDVFRRLVMLRALRPAAFGEVTAGHDGLQEKKALLYSQRCRRLSWGREFS